jgi:hypothetical protein
MNARKYGIFSTLQKKSVGERVNIEKLLIPQYARTVKVKG